MAKHRCPTCKKEVALQSKREAAESHFFPFCSQRCRLIDLGQWLDGEYRIPCRPDDADREESQRGQQ
jgi:endogenous inhibitor of DNA gyrase (YacG/DUF329 family)